MWPPRAPATHSDTGPKSNFGLPPDVRIKGIGKCAGKIGGDAISISLEDGRSEREQTVAVVLEPGGVGICGAFEISSRPTGPVKTLLVIEQGEGPDDFQGSRDSCQLFA